MKLHLIDFAQLIVGRLSGYDVAIDDFYIKPEREEKVDFSIPYGHSWTGLVARTDGPAPTKAGMKDLKFAVSLGSVQQKWLDEVLKPSQQYNTYDDTAQLFAALKAKQVDAVLIDLPVALPAATASKGDFKVFAQVKVGGQVGIVMIQPSPNRKAINTMVRADAQERHAEEPREEVLLRVVRRCRPGQAAGLGVARSDGSDNGGVGG